MVLLSNIRCSPQLYCGSHDLPYYRLSKPPVNFPPHTTLRLIFWIQTTTSTQHLCNTCTTLVLSYLYHPCTTFMSHHTTTYRQGPVVQVSNWQGAWNIP